MHLCVCVCEGSALLSQKTEWSAERKLHRTNSLSIVVCAVGVTMLGSEKFLMRLIFCCCCALDAVMTCV